MAAARGKEIAGVGIGSPGPLNTKTGIVLLTPNLGWTNYPLRDRVAAALNLPATLDNDANCASFGEWWRGAAPPFTENRAVGVVVERGGQIQCGRHPIAQRVVRPPQVGGEQHDAGLRIERAGRPDAHAGDLLAAGRGHGRARQLHDPREHRVRALFGDGRLGHQPQQLRAVLRQRPRDDIRSAEVNPDDVAHRSPRLPEGRAAPKVISCTSGAPTGNSAARAPSTGGTAGRPAGPRGPAALAARTRSSAWSTQRSLPSVCRPPARSGAGRCRSSPARPPAGSPPPIAAASIGRTHWPPDHPAAPPPR